MENSDFENIIDFGLARLCWEDIVTVAFVAVTDFGSTSLAASRNGWAWCRKSCGARPCASTSALDSCLQFALCRTCDDRVLLKPTSWLSGILSFSPGSTFDWDARVCWGLKRTSLPSPGLRTLLHSLLDHSLNCFSAWSLNTWAL